MKKMRALILFGNLALYRSSSSSPLHLLSSPLPIPHPTPFTSFTSSFFFQVPMTSNPHLIFPSDLQNFRMVEGCISQFHRNPTSYVKNHILQLQADWQCSQNVWPLSRISQKIFFAHCSRAQYTPWAVGGGNVYTSRALMGSTSYAVILVCFLYSFPSALMKYHKLGGENNRNVLLHSSRG